jgi:hypothetical protein
MRRWGRLHCYMFLAVFTKMSYSRNCDYEPTQRNTQEILLVNFCLAKKNPLQDMSKEALEMQNEKHIHGASVPKVCMFIMIK